MENSIAPVEQVVSASGEATIDNGEQIAKSVSFASHQKLLGEKKKAQTELESLRVRLEEIESEKLQTQGKYKEHAESLQKKLQETQAKERSLHKVYSEKVIRQQFASEAMKMGCVDPEDAFKLCDLAGVEVTDDFEFEADSLKSALSDLQKKKPYLFKKEVSAPKDSPPSNRINKPSGAELTKDELYAELSKLL